MGSVGSRDRVGLPDVHLRAAGPVLASSGVLIVLGWLPALGVSSTLDPLNVVRTLSIAVAYLKLAMLQYVQWHIMTYQFRI